MEKRVSVPVGAWKPVAESARTFTLSDWTASRNSAVVLSLPGWVIRIARFPPL
jgi:hypothetical protein